MHRNRLLIALAALALVSACTSEQTARDTTKQEASTASELSAFEVLVPGTTVKLALKPVPRGVLEFDAPPTETAPSATALTHVDVPAFWIASTETTWDMYDSFVFAMDRAETERDPPDAWTRPSKPYILMDRGFGHSGYPVISVSYKGATEFCKWLAAKTGKRFRLPTEVEWQRACAAGAVVDDAHSLGDRAWFKDNCAVDGRATTHPVAQKTPDSLGLFDMLGNAAEWTTSRAGTGVARGGSFKDVAADVSSTARRLDDKSLNKTDPQLPRSVWWLADGGFIGFRVMCEPEARR